PVDDPSDSRLAALMLWMSVPKGAGGESPGMAFISTAGPPKSASIGPNGVLTAGVNLDDMAWVDPSTGATLLSGQNGIGAVVLQDFDAYHQLGPMGPFDMGRFKVDRLAQAHGTGFPRLVPTSAGLLAVWAGGAPGAPRPLLVYAQPLDAKGGPTG